MALWPALRLESVNKLYQSLSKCHRDMLKHTRITRLTFVFYGFPVDLRGEKLNYKSVAKEISKPPFFGS